MIRVVSDPGVLIAALLSARGAPSTLLRFWLKGRFELIVSLARAVQADVLISGDKHLLGLVHADPPILTPGDLVGKLAPG